MSGDARTMITSTTNRLLEEVPALKPLKLVVGIDLHGRGDVQQFRLELPDVTVTKDLGLDAKVRLEMRRDVFNGLAEEGTLKDWRRAFETGRVKATGIDQYLKLKRGRRRPHRRGSRGAGRRAAGGSPVGRRGPNDPTRTRRRRPHRGAGAGRRSPSRPRRLRRCRAS
ncbi:MAG: hypothetical protein MUF56_07560 [Solirubrobacteraceae bacterium]|nr:hypothetical protein [Solirubrobacteraceae bacterium]